MMARLSQLDVFLDDKLRTGPQNMAVDQLLLQNCAEQALIRFYGWSRPEVSFGYFDTLESAQAKFDDDALHFVRRWTGGGMVDHRKDFTYTIVLPKGHAWASLRGAESYRIIHAAVVEMLKCCGVDAELIAEDSQNTSVACFDRPVTHDVIDQNGRKLAGAGQRRTRWGLLHQGSILVASLPDSWQELLVSCLSESSKVVEASIDRDEVRQLEVERYASAIWLNKR